MCFEQSKLEQYVCTINIIIHDICKTIDEWMSKIKLHASNFKVRNNIQTKCIDNDQNIILTYLQKIFIFPCCNLFYYFFYCCKYIVGSEAEDT